MGYRPYRRAANVLLEKPCTEASFRHNEQKQRVNAKTLKRIDTLSRTYTIAATKRIVFFKISFDTPRTHCFNLNHRNQLFKRYNGGLGRRTGESFRLFLALVTWLYHIFKLHMFFPISHLNPAIQNSARS
jgi:hypothetical protein